MMLQHFIVSSMSPGELCQMSAWLGDDECITENLNYWIYQAGRVRLKTLLSCIMGNVESSAFGD